MKISIVDYKVANIYNIVKAMEYLGAVVCVTDSAEDVQRAEKLILPGVGAYGAGVRGLGKHNLIQPIRAIASEGVPILGICLGAQLLMTEGREFGVFKGLDLIPGVVEHFPSTLKDVKCHILVGMRLKK
jgi:glutamine amidotransferase